MGGVLYGPSPKEIMKQLLASLFLILITVSGSLAQTYTVDLSPGEDISVTCPTQFVMQYRTTAPENFYIACENITPTVTATVVPTNTVVIPTPTSTVIPSDSIFDPFDGTLLSSNWGVYNGIARVSNGNLEINSPQFLMIARKDAFLPDQFSEATITGNTTQVQVFVRRSFSGGYQQRYAFFWTPTTPLLNAPAYSLKRDGALAAPYLLSVSGPAPVAGDTLRIEARGALLVGYVNGREIMRAVDSILTGGFPGVAAAPGPQAQIPMPLVKSWRGGNL